MSSYGDGNTYRGTLCKDSEVPTYRSCTPEVKHEQRIRELVQQCEKLREERNAVRVKVEQPLLLRIRELRTLVEEASGILIDSMLDEGYSDWMERADKALESPR